jgi:hypothetical protein
MSWQTADTTRANLHVSRQIAALLVPAVAYLIARAALSGNIAPLAIATGLPAVWVAGTAVRHGRASRFAFIPLVAFALALLVTVLTGGGSLVLELRDAALTGVIAIACLLSLALRRPLLMLVFAPIVRCRPGLGSAGNPRLRRTLTAATAILGATMALDCAVQVVLALTQSKAVFLAATSVTRPAILTAGAATIMLYASHARQRGS